jgi:hypothetical protein
MLRLERSCQSILFGQNIKPSFSQLFTIILITLRTGSTASPAPAASRSGSKTGHWERAGSDGYSDHDRLASLRVCGAAVYRQLIAGDKG